MAIDSIISKTLNAHEKIIKIQPLEEIKKFKDKMAIPLPQNTKLRPEGLLKWAKGSKVLEDSIVTIKMRRESCGRERIANIENDMIELNECLENIEEAINDA